MVQHWSNIGPTRPTNPLPSHWAPLRLDVLYRCWTGVGRVLDRCWTVDVFESFRIHQMNNAYGNPRSFTVSLHTWWPGVKFRCAGIWVHHGVPESNCRSRTLHCLDRWRAPAMFPRCRSGVQVEVRRVHCGISVHPCFWCFCSRCGIVDQCRAGGVLFSDRLCFRRGAQGQWVI